MKGIAGQPQPASQKWQIIRVWGCPGVAVQFPRYPNLIKGMTIECLNQVWLSDITCIHIRTGLVYLAAIPDAFFRKVIRGQSNPD